MFRFYIIYLWLGSISPIKVPRLGTYCTLDRLCISQGLSWWLPWVWQTCQSGLPNSRLHFTYAYQASRVNSHMEGEHRARCGRGDRAPMFSLHVSMSSPTCSLYEPHRLGIVMEVPLSRHHWPIHWSLVINWTSKLSYRPGGWKVSSIDPLTLSHPSQDI